MFSPATLRRSKQKDAELLKLGDAWTFHYDARNWQNMNLSDYESNVQTIGTFDTVQVSYIQYHCFFAVPNS